jgi:hypothetical protein
MKNIIIKYLSGQQIDINEAVSLIEEYMKKNNKVKPDFIKNMISHPAAPMLLDRAISISVEYLMEDYTITRLYSKENNLLMVY